MQAMLKQSLIVLPTSTGHAVLVCTDHYTGRRDNARRGAGSKLSRKYEIGCALDVVPPVSARGGDRDSGALSVVK